jgi:oligopeptidase B
MRSLLVPLLLALGCARPATVPVPAVDAGPPRPVPPVARRAPVTRTLHGDTLVDEYAWMKEKGTPELEAHLAAENAYTDEVLAPEAPLRAKLERELLARRPDVIDGAPYQAGAYEYWERSDVKRPFDQVWRRRLDGGAPELLLDLNTVAPDASYVNLLDLEVSDDEARLAWAIDTSGSREFVLHVTELDGGARWPQTFAHVTSFAWAADGRTLFYTEGDDAKRSYRLYRVDPGADAGVLLIEEQDERFDLGVSRSETRRLLVLESGSLTTSAPAVLDAKRPRGAFRPVVRRVQGQRAQLDERGAELVILSQDQGAEGRVYSVPASDPLHGKKTEWVPRQAGVVLVALDVTAQHLVVWERRDGVLAPRAIEWRTRRSSGLGLGPGVAAPARQLPGQTSRYRYWLTSPGLPPALFECDLASGETKTLWTDPVNGFDPASVEVSRTFAIAGDGTRIPLTVAKQRGVGPGAPTLLEGYGAYGAPLDPGFDPALVSLLQRGVVLAYAHVRGGGEFGEAWHDGGKLASKENTFTDFVACAEHLVKTGVTTPQRLVITGASAGGLLMGAVLNARPELFHAALAEVPFVDVLSTMLDPSLPLTVQEYEEWGDPRVAEQYAWMRAYSPYDNVKAQAYPSILVRTAYNDTQVLFHEPAKWVQRLRDRKTSGAPVLLWISMDPSGHSGRTSVLDVAKDDARRLGWLLAQWGIGE